MVKEKSTDDEPEAQCESKFREGWKKYSRTFVLIFSWASLGLYCEVLGPTLPTLKEQTSSNYEEMGSALAVRSVGLLSGSLLGGWTSDRFAHYRPLQMSVALILAALTNVAIPWVRSNSILSLVLYIAGCTHGFLTTNGNPLLASLWGSEAAGPFSMMHAGYGLGGAVAPLLVAPFTTNQNGSRENPLENLFAAASNASSSTVIIEPVVPYCIVAVTLVACACCFLIFNRFILCQRKCCRRPYITQSRRNQSCVSTDTRSLRSSMNAANKIWTVCRRRLLIIKQKTTLITVLLVLALFVIYFAIVGNERVFGKFMFTYAVSGPIRMNAKNGYLLVLLYWLCFCLARVITGLLSLVVPARILMFSVVVGTMLASSGLIFIPATELWFFIMTCMFSLFKSPLFPTTLAAINRSYEISGFVVMVVNFGSAAGASSMQYAAGSLIETYGHFVFPYIVFGSACVVLLTSVMLIILLRRIGDRFSVREYSAPSDDVSHIHVDNWIGTNAVDAVDAFYLGDKDIIQIKKDNRPV